MVDSAYFQTICLYFSMRGVSSKSYLLPSFIDSTFVATQSMNDLSKHICK